MLPGLLGSQTSISPGSAALPMVGVVPYSLSIASCELLQPLAAVALVQSAVDESFDSVSDGGVQAITLLTYEGVRP